MYTKYTKYTKNWNVYSTEHQDSSGNFDYGKKILVTWMKGLTDITDSMRSMRWTSDDYTRLTLKRATLDDWGTYCIMAKNRHGCDRAFFTVRLRERARSLTPNREPTQNILDDIPSYKERLYRKGQKLFFE